MRKLLALILIFALCACAPAWAEGVTDALGLTGSGESSVRGDLSARTDTDLYVVTNDGSDKVLMRIPRAGGASVRVDIRKGDAIKDGANIVGNHTKAKIVKNKLAPPFKTAEFDIIFGKGISQNGCILDLAVEKNIITKSGSFFRYNDEKIGQGRENTVQYLADNPEVGEEIKARIMESVKNGEQS